MKDEKDEQPQQTHNVSKTQSAPRKHHGTRVVFHFTCSGCGTESSLDYKPKGVPLTEILCEICMQAKEGTERWKMVREKKEMETAIPEYEYACVECGRIEIMGRPARHAQNYICTRCGQEQATPNASRLEGAEAIDSTLKVRRKRKVIEPSE